MAVDLDDMLICTLSQYKNIEVHTKLNYTKIPCNILDVSEKGMRTFNELINIIHKVGLPKLVRTKSGGISISRKNFRHYLGYDVRALKSCVEITIAFHYAVRIQFRNNFKDSDEKNNISGSTAYKVFKQTCEKWGIDISEYFVDNGEEIKKTIPKPMAFVKKNKESKMWKAKAHHIDIHSAYMGAIAEEYVDLFFPINEIYQGRKDNPVNKGVLTHSYGFFQSKIINYRLANLSKIAVEKTIEKLKELTTKIEESGGFVLAYNTDGIWYYGDVYHGEGEGNGLFQWSNDYINCDIWFNSIGQYAFKGTKTSTKEKIEKVVARGRYELDKIKPREEWTMNDIIHNKLGKSSLYRFDPTTETIIKEEE